jgi:hypothetical protein
MVNTSAQQAAFTVKVGDHEYHIWEDGRVEGFGDGKAPVTIFNRIPSLMREAERRAGVSGQDIRMQCISLAMGLTSTGHRFESNLEVAKFSDLLAQYVLTGKFDPR